VNHSIHPSCRILAIALVCAGAVGFSSCHGSKAAITKRYALTGRVVSIDNQNQSALIDGDAVPGFMSPMQMSYKIKPAADLSQLAPGDSISADVVVVESDAKSDDAAEYWLENVKVTAHAKAPPTAGLHAPQGEWYADSSQFERPENHLPVTKGM
jgi:Cu/Ag efflux protein CusF